MSFQAPSYRWMHRHAASWGGFSARRHALEARFCQSFRIHVRCAIPARRSWRQDTVRGSLISRCHFQVIWRYVLMSSRIGFALAVVVTLPATAPVMATSTSSKRSTLFT